MSWSAPRGLIVALAAAAALTGSSSAQARVPLALLRARADAWKQVEPLLRAKASHPSGFDFEPTFEIDQGDGYKIKVTAAGSAVAVLVGRGTRAVTAYLARGTASSRRLKASFGTFGELDMRFHPAEPAPRKPRCARHRRFSRRPGTWTGKFRFLGEGGYLSIDAHRASGGIRRPRVPCPHLRADRPRGPRATSSRNPFSSFSLRQAFAAGWHRGLESADLFGFELGGRTQYVALTQQVFGRVGVIRVASVRDKGRTFTVNDALTHAEASPSHPFHGSGTFTAFPDGTTAWTGDLTVNFPGAPAFPLTGDQFKVEVRRPL